METLLIEQWLGGLDAIEILDEASLTLVRDAIRAVPAPSDVIDRALLVASELGRNHLRHARWGHVAVRAVERDGTAGVEIVAADAGPGIDDLDGAFDGPGREAGSLGVGIGSVRRLSTELDVDVRRGEGTCFRVRLFDRAVPRHREVGVYGRPIVGESASGDHAMFTREGSVIRAVVCDGLGHGPDARAAADAAMAVFRERHLDPPAVLIEESHRRLHRTRGVVMLAAHVSNAGALELASVGNVEAMVAAFHRSRRFGGTSATVGGRPGPMKPRVEVAALVPDDVVILMTDGIQTKASVENEATLLRAHPASIAQHVLERFARPNDDALVLVVR